MITRLRSQQIIIDLPKPESEPWINIIVQKVEMDDNYNTLNVVDRWASINEKISNIATDVVPYDDPVHPVFGISGAGIADALTRAAIVLIMRKCGGTVDEHGYIIVD